MTKSREGLMQIFNADKDPVFIELLSGNAFWIIPAKYKLSDVRFLTHQTEDGNSYFENLETGEVSWSFPPDDIMTESSRNNAISFQLMSRSDTEDSLLEPFPEYESAEQLAALDAFFESPDRAEQADNADGTGSESSVPMIRPSRINRENTHSGEFGYSSDEGEAEDALASINNKRGRPSPTYDDTGSEDSTSGMFKSLQGVFEPSGNASRPMSVVLPHKTIESVREITIKVCNLVFFHVIHICSLS